MVIQIQYILAKIPQLSLTKHYIPLQIATELLQPKHNIYWPKYTNSQLTLPYYIKTQTKPIQTWSQLTSKLNNFFDFSSIQPLVAPFQHQGLQVFLGLLLYFVLVPFDMDSKPFTSHTSDLCTIHYLIRDQINPILYNSLHLFSANNNI